MAFVFSVLASSVVFFCVFESVQSYRQRKKWEKLWQSMEDSLGDIAHYARKKSTKI